MPADIGKKAPDFKMATDTGSVSLKALAGKKVVLYFYPKDDTSGCTKEAIEFSALKKDFDKAGAVVIGVSKDSATSHGKFRTKHKLAVELGADESGVVCEAYGVWVEKSMYGKKYMGIERSTFLIGADGKIAQVWRKVKVPDHAKAVLAAVKLL
jgi:thioredoxin-dependent peroxiredoxin